MYNPSSINLDPDSGLKRIIQTIKRLGAKSTDQPDHMCPLTPWQASPAEYLPYGHGFPKGVETGKIEAGPTLSVTDNPLNTANVNKETPCNTPPALQCKLRNIRLPCSVTANNTPPQRWILLTHVSRGNPSPPCFPVWSIQKRLCRKVLQAWH